MSRAIVLERPGQLRLEDRDVPEPRADEVLVRVAWAGICGSDVDLQHGLRPSALAQYPVVPGHEWSGIVQAVGVDVDESLVGELVVAEGIRPCGACAPCLAGDAPRCQTRYDETGFTKDGAWADHLTIPGALVHALPHGVDLRSAAGIEPAACAATAVERAQVEAGERVAVIGGGTIGLLAAQLLRATRPAELVIVEPVAARWEVAERCGATRVIAPEAATDDLFDLVIEAAGVTGTAQDAVRRVRRGGRVVIAGIPPDNDRLLTQEIVTKLVDVHTVCGATRRAWDMSVRAFSDGSLDPGLLVTHELPLEEAAQALELVERGDGVGKVLLRP